MNNLTIARYCQRCGIRPVVDMLGAKRPSAFPPSICEQCFTRALFELINEPFRCPGCELEQEIGDEQFVCPHCGYVEEDPI